MQQAVEGRWLMIYNIDYAYTSNVGLVRGNQEDNFWCDGSFMPQVNSGTAGVFTGTMNAEDVPAFAVFDGMGGESCGEAASWLAAEGFDEYYKENKKKFRQDPRIYTEEVSKHMNRKVCAFAEENHIRSMGSTSVMVLFGDDWFAASNLGDSRIYTLTDKKLLQISTDHVFRGGGYRKPPLVQYLGLEESEGDLEPSFVREKITPGMRILLCSDGVTDMIEEDELEKLMSMEESVEKTAEVILNTALEHGGRDNTTLILLQASGGQEKQGFGAFLRGLFGRKKKSEQ